MPAIFLERLPMPSLRTYVSGSVVLIALAMFYAHQTVKAKINYNPETAEMTGNYLPPDLVNLTLPYPSDEHFLNLLFIMRVETWCIWALVNSCYCSLILLAKGVQVTVFGDLRVVEQQHLKDKFWNFIFYKFIFIFGVMNVQSLEEVLLWLAWFSVLGALHMATLLSKDRFEYLSFSPASPRWSHVKLVGLLGAVLAACGGLAALAGWVAFNVSLTVFAFLAAETLLLTLKCLYVMTRYCIQLYDLSLHGGVWEARALWVYYSELFFELVTLVVDFGHHMHMLLYGNIFLSMASLVICMQLRFLFYELQRRIKRHKNYLKVVKDMEDKFPMATQEDLEANSDDCAICWEKMETARKLPCGHLFHNWCLRSWLEQDTSCPTCRTTLSETPRSPAGPDAAQAPPPDGQPGGHGDPAAAMMPAAAAQATTNHFFHFDGSRYVSWLPSFSVEVSHMSLLAGHPQGGQAAAAQTSSQLDAMAREVQAVFPNLSPAAILEDLRITHSVELTIDNILEGLVTSPPGHVAASASPPLIPDASAQLISTQPAPALEAEPRQPSPPPAVAAVPAVSVAAAGDSGAHDQDLLQLPQATAGWSVSSAGGDSVLLDVGGQLAGGRFSKSADERQSILEQRKAAMVEAARRRYQAKQRPVVEPTNKTESDNTMASSVDSLNLSPASSSYIPSASSHEEDPVRRRQVLLEATQRRLDLNNPSQPADGNQG